MDEALMLRRRSIRLKGYKYSLPGAYFVTTVVQGRRCVVGRIMDGLMTLSNVGGIVEYVWLDLPKHYPNVQLDESYIMPNHVHGIFVLTACRGGSGSGLAKVTSLSGYSSGSCVSPERPAPTSYPRSSGRLNHFRPGGLTGCRIHPADLSGNADITSISSGMKKISDEFMSIFSIIPYNGNSIRKIQNRYLFASN